MFKSTSSHSQFATRNVALNGRGNGHGVDPTVFAGIADDELDETTRLTIRKKQLEKAAYDLKLRIGDAHARLNGFKSGKPTGNSIFNKWVSDRNKMLAEIAEIDVKFLKMKAAAKKANCDAELEQERRFERVFMRMAKEMLAGPVYERIVIAAIHRAEDEENS